MRKTWQEHFDLSDQIAQVAERAGIPRLRAAQLAARLASRPLPRAQAARVLRQVHGPCTGCPTCDPEMARALRAFSAGDYETYCAWLRKKQAEGLRRMRSASLRTNIRYEEDTMAFQPRLTALGQPCCVETLPDGRRKLPAHPCPKCAEHFGRTPRAASEFEPPDPYKAGIAKLQQADAKAAAGKTYQPAPRPTTTPLDEHGIPDAYAAGLEQMRREGR